MLGDAAPPFRTKKEKEKGTIKVALTGDVRLENEGLRIVMG